MGDTTSVKDLIERFDDEKALAGLVQQKERALPAIRRAIRALEPDDGFSAGWYVRILEAVSEDLVQDCVKLIATAGYPVGVALGWAILRRADKSHGPLLQKALTSLAWAGKSSPPASWPDRIGFYGGTAAAAFLSLALARLDVQESLRILEWEVKACKAQIAQLGKDGQSSYEMFYRDSAPVGAAAAAGLLGWAERHGASDEKLRSECRALCVETALDKAINYGFTITSPPLFFLFAGAPQEATRLCMDVVRASQDKDQTFCDIAGWLREGKEKGVLALLSAQPEGMQDFIEEISQHLEDAKSWAIWSPRNVRAPLAVLSNLDQDRGLREALALLKDGPIATEGLEEATKTVTEGVPLRAVAGIVVEAALSNRHHRDQFKSIQIDDEARINARLKSVGLAEVRGWDWEAPAEDWGSVDEREGLNGSLCAMSAAFRKIGPSSKGIPRALVPVLSRLGHALFRHATYRNLLLCLKRLPKTQWPPVLQGFIPFEQQRDVHMLRSLLTMATDILKDKASAFYPLLLDSPLLPFCDDLATALMERMRDHPCPDALVGLTAFKNRLLAAGRSKKDKDFDLFQRLDEAILNLGSQGAVWQTCQKVEAKDFVSQDEQMTLLRLEAQAPGSVPRESFRKVARQVLQGGYGTWSGWEEAILGDALRAFIEEVLDDEALSNAEAGRISEFLFWSAPYRPPARALAFLLGRLPDAMDDAQSHPGAEWEDRNWSGYNQTPEEETAVRISDAALRLAEAKYSREGWKALVQALETRGIVNLTRVSCISSSGSSMACATADLWSLLKRGLKKLKDPKIDEALKAPSTAQALAQIAAVL